MLVFPNAKINLGLYVTGKRPDGYHNIESVFYPVGLCDALEITRQNAPWSVKSSGFSVEGDPEKNLCLKAARLFSERFSIPSSTIHLHKAIPMGAGLGGGSADAAFTLMALNEVNGRPATNGELFDLAMQIGSDCGFFILNKPCYVMGRGEVVQSIDVDLQGYFLVIVKPHIHVSTVEAYSMITPGLPLNDLSSSIASPPEKWKDLVFNDFEKPIAEKFPVIQKIKSDLYDSGALYASMTGSGSAVFGIFRNEVDLKNQFASEFYWAGRLG